MGYCTEHVGQTDRFFQRCHDSACFLGELFGVRGGAAPDADFREMMDALKSGEMSAGLNAATEDGEHTGGGRKQTLRC